MHRALRTCVGCRTVRPQAELLRTRHLGGRVVPVTVSRTLEGPQGRSAYLCPDRTCLAQAVRRGGMHRAFAGRTGKGPNQPSGAPRREKAAPQPAVRGLAGLDVDALWAAMAEEVIRESDRLQRSGAESRPSVAPGAASRVQRLQALAVAMRASGRNA